MLVNGSWFIVHGSLVNGNWFMVHSSLVNWLGWLALSPCGLATYDMQTEMSSLPTGGLCLPFDKHEGILTYFQTMSTRK